MRKLIASINVTLDGFCNHTAVIADDDLHQHYNDLFKNSGLLLFGRKTYQLMESAWPAIVKDPTGNKPTDEFAILIDNIPKIVFSRTLKEVSWKNTKLFGEGLEKEVIKLKTEPGKNILVGSPTLIAELTQAGLIDEYLLCINPIILGNGLTLFKDIQKRVDLKLLKSSSLKSGVIIVQYEALKNA
jgi:dihydrofolate reductase